MDSVLRDIMSEPGVVADTIAEGEARLPKLAERLRKLSFDKIYTIGTGSSNFVGLAGRYALEEWAGIPTLPLSSIDFQVYSLQAADSRSIVIAMSQSGETFETIGAARAAKQRGIYTVALTNNDQSRLAQICDDVILTRAGDEEGPGTKTVVAQCVAIYHFALHMARIFKPEKATAIASALRELGTAPEQVREMLSGQFKKQLDQVSRQLCTDDNLYMVGEGPFSALAMQSANMLREAGKLHCYPFDATEFRHGPLEALSENSHLMILSNAKCQAHDQLVRACTTAMNAGVNLIYVGDLCGRPDAKYTAEVLLPSLSELLAAQIYLAPLQLMGYMVAKNKGLNPDQFINIIKTWTE